MLEYFRGARRGIAQSIGAILSEQSDILGRVSPLGQDLATRLESFALGGKMIRGILVRLGYELCAPPCADMDLLLDRAGAAMELFQAGLLIHDDIMDRDSLRRSMPTIHEQYKTAFASADANHSGISLGICAGDVAFFLGMRVLSSLPAANPVMAGRIGEASSFAAAELCLVGVAQMQDVLAADSPAQADPGEEDILKLYRYKTGRYTFSLPLVVGALLAGAGKGNIGALDAAGEYLGMVFQLKDDELGLFADPATLGKVPGSDIKENKKTLHRRLLFDRSSLEQISQLKSIFGKSALCPEDIDFVRSAMDQSGVRRDVALKMREFARLALEHFALADSVEDAARNAFLELSDYSLSRES